VSAPGNAALGGGRDPRRARRLPHWYGYKHNIKNSLDDVKKTGALEWFSEERVLRQAREAWQAMNSDQREEYGETHFQETVRAVHDYIKDDKVI
jgi:hypothetical protein